MTDWRTYFWLLSCFIAPYRLVCFMYDKSFKIDRSLRLIIPCILCVENTIYIQTPAKKTNLKPISSQKVIKQINPLFPVYFLLPNPNKQEVKALDELRNIVNLLSFIDFLTHMKQSNWNYISIYYKNVPSDLLILIMPKSKSLRLV